MLWLWITLGVVGFILLIFIIMFIITYKIHSKMFNKRFTPPAIDSYTSEEFGLEAKRLEVNYKGKVIRGYFYSKGEYDKNKLLIFAHGMESSKESYIQEIAYLAENGFQVIGFDYFGTNESDGKLMGFGNSLLSLNVVINYLKNNEEYKNKELYIVGHSWGGYATTNIVKYHKDIKGVVALAPAVSLYKIFRGSYLKQNILVTLLIWLVECVKLGKYSLCNGAKSLKKYDGKIMVIQSKNDSVVSFESSLGYIEKKIGNKAEYVVMEDRFHNPDYKKEAVDKLMKLYQDIANTSQDKLPELFAKQDFRAMGELDPVVMDKIVNFVK